MKQLVALLAVLLMAGCATTPEPRSSQTAAAISDWQLDGRVSLTHGEQGWHASLRWQVQADSYFLRVSGPLGQGGFQLTGTDSSVVLVNADGQTFVARDADALFEQVTGWQLPVTGLRYWVRGLPAPTGGAVQTSRDEAGRLSHLVQSGWTVNYNKYQLVGGVSLPGKLQLLRGDISVRIVVDNWELGAVNALLP